MKDEEIIKENNRVNTDFACCYWGNGAGKKFDSWIYV